MKALRIVFKYMTFDRLFVIQNEHQMILNSHHLISIPLCIDTFDLNNVSPKIY